MRFRDRAYSYDDVLLEPQHSNKTSRYSMNIYTHTKLTKKTSIDIPIVAANMDTITESSMMSVMSSIGGAAILHRFMNDDRVVDELEKARTNKCNVRIFSIGLGQDNKKTLAKVNKADVATGVCIDVAHGDCDRVVDLIHHIKEEYPHWDIIAGNVATPEATKRLCLAGADAIKVGIGPGSLCTTRIVTGCGVPQLSAVIECAAAARRCHVPVIADGGIRTSGDIVKALAAGASSVMIGSLLAGTDETPGEVVIDPQGGFRVIPPEERIPDGVVIGRTEIRYKKYQGMASRDAMVGWKGEADRTPEGESKLIECRGPVENIICDLMGGVRSGMTYLDAGKIFEMHENAVFIPVTPLGYGENGAHGLK